MQPFFPNGADVGCRFVKKHEFVPAVRHSSRHFFRPLLNMTAAALTAMIKIR